MKILSEFERRLEGAVEGFFARAFRSGLQPIELAKALPRYGEEHGQLSASGTVVPNVYRFRVSPEDHERLAAYGDRLPRELADVVVRTAEERGWELPGPAVVHVVADPEIKYGMFALNGRGEPGAADEAAAPAAGDTTGVLAAAATPETVSGGLTLVGPDGTELVLSGDRCTVGRLRTCDLQISDSTVSREHAAFVKRADGWWVLDLGSTNGTTVNGTRVAEHAVRPGDEVTVGDVTLTLRER